MHWKASGKAKKIYPNQDQYSVAERDLDKIEHQ
jgi:hypothetical protein